MTDLEFHIQVDPNVESIVMPENVKIGLMVTEHRKNCSKLSCSFDYHAFAIGQSPFHVPEPLEASLRENTHQSHYSASIGISELREAIAEFNNRYFNFNIDPSLVVIGHGTKGMIFTIFSLIKGDVIIPAPSWISYVPQIKLLGKNFHIIDLKPEDEYKLTAENLDNFLSNLHQDQHLLVLNSPHNPSGAVYRRDELEKLADICRKHGILVLSDEIYALATYDQESFASMRSDYPEGTFVTNGLSKDRGAAGYRLGHCLLPENCSEELQLNFKKIAATIYTNVSTPTQYAAITAYKQNDVIDEYIKITREIHRIMGTNLSREVGKIEGLEVTTPTGGFYFLVSFNKLKNGLLKHNVKMANELSNALLKHPFHIAALTGDACLFNPDDFTARVAFVDYDGRQAFNNYKIRTPRTEEEESEFFKTNAPRMFQAITTFKEFVTSLK
ncbi:aminotransferase class I/II [Candidatus Heimdallarchaeota archaeon B3_Heim]|nr:MAG: aminotransferase class I/II [Candidatus Heimdallarchaeota archaeon B3_Heim]